MSPVIYRVTKDGNPAEITVHLGRMKKYVVPRSSPIPDLDALDGLFLETTLPVPDLEGSLSKVMIGAFTVCLLYTSPSPRDLSTSRMPSSA